jgi:chloramphenicol 3-O-phosphotransferase
MKLIFLHGAPASGKLTVAKALLRVVSGRLFDNHTAIDFAQTVFDFGAPGFWERVHDVRVSALDAASHHGIPLVVTTYCYSEPQDRSQFEQFDALMQRHGGELLPIFLHCAEDEIARRIGNADRAGRRKITSMEGLTRFSAGHNYAPAPRANCLKLDTTARPAGATAQEIVRHFALGE